MWADSAKTQSWKEGRSALLSGSVGLQQVQLACLSFCVLKSLLVGRGFECNNKLLEKVRTEAYGHWFTEG